MVALIPQVNFLYGWLFFLISFLSSYSSKIEMEYCAAGSALDLMKVCGRKFSEVRLKKTKTKVLYSSFLLFFLSFPGRDCSHDGVRTARPRVSPQAKDHSSRLEGRKCSLKRSRSGEACRLWSCNSTSKHFPKACNCHRISILDGSRVRDPDFIFLDDWHWLIWFLCH